MEAINELHLFAGGGGGILGGMLLGHTCVCAVEIEPYCRKILLQRQRDGILPKFPIWDDVRTFDGNSWRGLVDVVCGGFPCQDISVSSQTRSGIDGERSGLWEEMWRVVCDVRPRFVFVENSPALTYRGLGRVLADLAAMGFDARWCVLSAADVELPHFRERIWILAHSLQNGRIRTGVSEDYAAKREWRVPTKWSENRFLSEMGQARYRTLYDSEICESDATRVVDGLASIVDSLATTGNGQVPSVVKLAWETLTSG